MGTLMIWSVLNNMSTIWHYSVPLTDLSEQMDAAAPLHTRRLPRRDPDTCRVNWPSHDI